MKKLIMAFSFFKEKKFFYIKINYFKNNIAKIVKCFCIVLQILIKLKQVMNYEDFNRKNKTQ